MDFPGWIMKMAPIGDDIIVLEQRAINGLFEVYYRIRNLLDIEQFVLFERSYKWNRIVKIKT